MKVVAPYRPFAVEAHPESDAIVSFDWIDALRMLNHTVERTCGTSVVVLTDAATVVPLPALRYDVAATRLQQWLVAIRLAYLESDAFDEDTVLVSPDTLLLANIGEIFTHDMDLAMLVRPHVRFLGGWKAILNSVQWWKHRAKDRLITFYRHALAISGDLDEALQVWGGDTEALRQLVEPITTGVVTRDGLRVDMIEARLLFRSLSGMQIEALRTGAAFPRQQATPILDFKYNKKVFMRGAFDALFPTAGV